MVTEPFSYQVIRSNRKTMTLQISGETVTVRCPRLMPDAQVRAFVERKTPWILKHLASAAEVSALPEITPEELNAWVAQAKEILPERVAIYAKALGVTYGNVTVRHQRSRWGSCSSRGNLSFNCLLTQMPLVVLDYVVVHELCHRIEMNHSARFWALVEHVMPDYRVHRRWLKQNGAQFIGRLPK